MTIESASSNIDYVMMARTALTKAEKLSDEIEGAPAKVPQCREAWRDYGAALLEQRKLMPSDPQFGQWVKANGLDLGRASNAQTRSDAMWLAENWGQFTSLVNCNQHNPAYIRQACRDAGYEWAGATARTRASKTKPRKIKAAPPPPSMGWVEAVTPLLDDIGRTYIGFRVHAEKKRDIAAEYGQPIPQRISDPEAIRALAAAVQRCALRANPPPQATITVMRTALPPTRQRDFDRLVEQQTARIRAELQAQVKAAVEQRAAAEAEALKKERSRFYESTRKAEEAEDRYRNLARGLPALMTREDYKMVLGCLHPDRPDRSPEALHRAFIIFTRLGENVQWEKEKA
jgi:hypothetical protein